MKKIIYLNLAIILAATVLTGCEKEKPSVITIQPNFITSTSALCGGSINSGEELTSEGVCWGLTNKITIDSSTVIGYSGTFACQLSGLKPSTVYYVCAFATNSEGTGYGRVISFTTLGEVPGKPIIGTATAGDTQATVTFTAPDNNSGPAITGYSVTSSPGNITATGSASPITVTGLTNGIAYTFTVTATNANGAGVASSASNSVTPGVITTVPGAPTIGTATGGNAQATITFTAPSSNGGSAITGYTVISSPGNITGTGTASPITVTGLTNGTAYTFTVTATNSVGTSVASSASNSVTPAVPITVPGAPAIGTATVGNAQAVITFTAPVSNGGSAITGYTVTSSPGGITGTGSASPITVTGLTNGTAYTFTVTATNSVGTSVASSVSNSVTPLATLISDIDGNIYNTVLIGTQVWMKENLKTTKYNDGTTIPNITDNNAAAALTTGAYSWYNNDVNNKNTYGALYNWYAVDNKCRNKKQQATAGKMYVLQAGTCQRMESGQY